jgi:hypothetical protein
MPSTVEFSSRKPAGNRSGATQGRQDSNLQPAVLETAAHPVELRPYAVVTQRKTARPYRDGRRFACAARYLSHPSEVLPSCLTWRSQDCAGTPSSDGRMHGVA